MTNKMTYAMALEIAIASIDNTEAREKLEALKGQLAKRNASKSDKPTKTQKENADLKESILAFMETDKKYTITDIMKSCEAVAELSNQRVSALVRQLKESGELRREEIKRKAYFSLVVED